MSGIMESAGTRHWRHAPSAASLVPSSLMLQRRRLPLLAQGKVWEQAAGGLQWSQNGLSDPGLWHHCGSLLILGRKRAEIRGLGTVSLNVHMQRVPAAASSFGFGVGLRKRRHLVSDFRGGRGRRNLSLIIRSHTEIASGVEIINSLGLDTLTFLAATVFFVPAFKAIKASPILGFLLSGVILNQLGLIRNVTEIKALAELGILFLLFEMGLELSLARLKALAKFAFGIGLAQVILCTLAFTAFELPPGGAMGTKILEFMFHAKPSLVDIRSIDEAVVIGAALSLSSSAFVLQLLAEKGELPTRFGSATLGILLLQDIAVVPLLVILPILESGNFTEESLWPMLAVESLKALGGLGALSFGGQLFLRRLFEIVADSRSSEAFVALCLLTVTGTSLLTQMLGFSDTLGAFLAGALLAETNYRTQVEADIRPFRGLLLGLFFVTTGTSIDMQLLLREWPNIVALLVGLITIKTSIIIAIGPRVGLTLAESVRLGLLLSQGGEFAFVVFSLANRLGVLPLELNRLLIIVVVLSMALTPFLNELGRKAAEMIEAGSDGGDEFVEAIGVRDLECNSPVVILGFGQMGQVLANFLSAPLATGHGGDAAGWPYVAFDLDPGRVKAARKLGFPVLYGDGARPAVLETVGISIPKAVMVMYTGRQKAVRAVERLRLAFPGVPIYARAQDLGHLLELKAAGATDAILENAETSLELGSVLLRGLGVLSDDVVFLRRLMRESMELRAQEALEKKDAQEGSWFGPFQAKVKQAWRPRSNSKPAASYEDEASSPAASASTNSKPTVWSAGNAQTGSASSQLLSANGARPDVQSAVLEPGNGSFLDDGEPGGSILSASVAVVAPTGLILEKQPGSGTGSGSASQEQQQQQQEQQQPQQEQQQARTGAGYGVLPDALTVTMSCEPAGAATESTASQQTSLASSRLKWRKVRRFSGEEDGGVTVCSLEPPSEELVAGGESEDEAEDELDQSLPCIELEMRGSKDRDC